MSFLDEPVRQSVAPPGWSTPPELAPPPAPSAVPALPRAAVPGHAIDAADAAVRWRIRAARIDNLIVYGGYLLACLALHWRVASPTHLLWLAVAGVAYHFALESRGGQTLGKRRYGIRVVAADGRPARPRAIAIRSLVRLFDSLPVCYVSGLISMVRTGPARRQRIGDIAAGTVVVAVDGHAVRRGTPGWMLPVATIGAVIVSALTVIGLATAGHRPIDSMQASQFIAGCQNSSGGGSVDCGCFLSKLEAEGYDTPDALNNLAAQAQSEEAAGRTGPYRTTLQTAALACRTPIPAPGG
jgi:uncharacterized RDD family membrane protein YckC